MANSRDDFKKKDIAILQKRVGGLCSNPDCKTLTTGPHTDREKSTNMGIAAHITAAALNGPRYNEHLTIDQRKDISNGIWLCLRCSTMIDKDSDRFGVELLQKWKQEAEKHAQDVIDGKATHIPHIVLETIENKLKEKNILLEDKDTQLRDLKEKYISLNKSLENKSQINEFAKQAKEALSKGNFKEAEELLLEDIESNNKQNAQSYFEIAELALLQMDYNKALMFNEKALMLDITNLIYMTALASINCKLDEYEKAIDYYYKILDIQVNEPNNDMKIAKIYNDLGTVYSHFGEPLKAKEYFEKALEIYLNDFENNKYNISIIFNNIGGFYYKYGEHDEAIIYYKKALKLIKVEKGIDSIDEARTLNNIGLSYNSKKYYHIAIRHAKKALKIRLKYFGDNHLATSQSYNNLGLFYCSNKKYYIAMAYLTKALKIRLIILGENHSATATTYLNIASNYYINQKYIKAIEYYEKGLNILEIIFGNNCLELSKPYNNIAIAYEHIYENNKALEYYKKSLLCIEKKLGAEHKFTEIIKNNIETLLRDRFN
ncbi:MAG: tetratricopeptide repeat protein [Sulfurimonas sp.]|uniref:tetratricopeptide repeat protein n=1 Tax=Sulfurimonas sp. TaxID=2022749 RepID=UPI003D1370F0